jgi:hypothetical protein
MESEWDVLAGIRNTLEALPLTSHPNFEHIKGHQDEKIPFEKLSLSAQLNCKAADAYADQYLQDHQDIQHSRAPMFPTAGCQLHLAHGTTTHDIKKGN